jgi:pimeloyl-ACP methyl ester carboxylesterase
MKNHMPLWIGLTLLISSCVGSAGPVVVVDTTFTVETAVSSVVTTSISTASEEPEVSTTTPPVPEEVPRFVPGPCVGDGLAGLAASVSYRIECGSVIALEDRDDPNGSTVSLPVAIARTSHEVPKPDPVIYLAGGGGHAHLDYAHYLIESVGDAVLVDRDFIQYNQRGAPDTDPEFSCPGYTEFLFTLASEPELDSLWTAEHRDYLAECEAALIEAGVDVTQYNSATNAADAADVALALGYEQANYYGTSYGTRLGLDLIRDYPDAVRSIILDSVYPPEVGYYTEYARSLQRAFTAVFDGCSSDLDCATMFPNLEADFYKSVDRLNADPQTVNSPFGPVSVDGGVFMDAMSVYLYSPEWIVRAPKAMDDVAQGHLGSVEKVVVGAITAPDLNWSMFYAMQCREEVPFEDWDVAVSLGADLPDQVVAHYTEGFARFHFEMCEGSASGTAAVAESEAVQSDVPALVLAGGFDPATPPYWSENAATSLGNAFFVEFPTLGHGIMRSNSCGLSIGLAFLDDPTNDPDTTCVALLPPVAFDID